MNENSRPKPNRWVVLGLAALACAVVVSIATELLRRPPLIPVPEPVPPVTLIEANGFMDGGSKVVRMRDAAGNDFAFTLTHFEDVHGECQDINHRLFLGTIPAQGRMTELHSMEEERLGRALKLAIENQLAHPDPAAHRLGDDEWNVAFAKTTLAWFKTLGDPLPP